MDRDVLRKPVRLDENDLLPVYILGAEKSKMTVEQVLQCPTDFSGGYGQLTTLYGNQQSLASHCSIITEPRSE